MEKYSARAILLVCRLFAFFLLLSCSNPSQKLGAYLDDASIPPLPLAAKINASSETSAISLNLANFPAALLLVPRTALAPGTTVTITQMPPPAAISSYLRAPPIISLSITLRDEHGDPAIARSPLLISVPQDTLSVDPLVLQMAHNSQEVHLAETRNYPLSNDDKKNAPTILENSGIKESRAPSIEKKLVETCRLDSLSLLTTQEGISRAEDALVVHENTVDFLLNTTILTAISSSSFVVVTSDVDLSPRAPTAELFPASLAFNQGGESVSPGLRVLSLHTRPNTSPERLGVYDEWVMGTLILSEEYLDFLSLLYLHHYLLAPAIPALRRAHLDSFAELLTHLQNSPQTVSQRAEQLVDFSLKLTLILRNKKSGLRDLGCNALVSIFMPLRADEATSWSPYRRPYQQEDFYSFQQRGKNFSCQLGRPTEEGEVNWQENLMENIHLEEYEVVDSTVNSIVRAAPELIAAAENAEELRRKDAMNFIPVAESGGLLADSYVPPLASGLASLRDVECTSLSPQAAPSALLRHPTFIGARTGMWISRWNQALYSPLTLRSTPELPPTPRL